MRQKRDIAMSIRSDFMFENYEEFFGDIEQVRKIIDNCQNCGNIVVHSYITDYLDMFVQESSRCPMCGGKKIKKIFSIN